MNFEQSIEKVMNFRVVKAGRDAFEEEYQHCIVLFMTDGVYWYWTPDPRGNEDFYNYGKPGFVAEAGINYIIEHEAYEMPELARQVEADKAWGFDL